MKIKTNLYIYFLLAFSFCLSVVQILLNLRGEEISDATDALWSGVFLLTTIFWAYYDADRRDFDKPFDFGFLIYVFWPIALPWYLIKTRGIEGLLIFLGFMAIWLGPWLAGLVAYVYFT